MRAVLFFMVAARLVLAASYTTYIGDGNPSTMTALVTDLAGNTYVTGSRTSVYLSGYGNLPGPDGFVTKLDAAGKILFTRTFGAQGAVEPKGVAVDPSGNIYVAGRTTSPDLLVSRPLPGTAPPSTNFGTGFVIKLSPDATTVLYASYFWDVVAAIATDSQGNLYLTGGTSSAAFPATAGFTSGAANSFTQAAYVTKLSPSGGKVYSGVFTTIAAPCPTNTCGVLDTSTAGGAIAVNAAGEAYVGGNGTGTLLPSAPGTIRRGPGGFIVKIKADGSGFGFANFIGTGYQFLGRGSNDANTVSSIALDASGNVLVAGSTFDDAFPATPGAYQTARNDGSGAEGFAAKFLGDGTKLMWATYLGRAGFDAGQSISADGKGNAWAVGAQTGTDALVQLDAAGALVGSVARYPGMTVGRVVLAESTSGTVHIAGSTGIVSAIASSDAALPRVFGIVDAAYGEVGGRFYEAQLISIYGTNFGPPKEVSAATGGLPTSLGGVEVIAGDTRLPLLYVSNTQINALAVVGASTIPVDSIRVVYNSESGQPFRVVSIGKQPQVFRSADGKAAALNQDGTINSPANPAILGSLVTVFANSGSGNGQIATVARNQCICAIRIVGDQVLGEYLAPATVTYGGPAPGQLDAITQINFRLPASGSPSAFVLGVGLAALDSDPFTLWIKN